MKKFKKNFLTMGVCLAILFCFLAPAQTVDAAPKTAKVTVCYKGKKVTFGKLRIPDKGYSKFILGIKTCAVAEKAWGEADEVKKYDDDDDQSGYSYTWKSGKTKINFSTQNNKRITSFNIDIQDKKATLCGIKVGMSKKQVLQKLRKQFGKKNIYELKGEAGKSIFVALDPVEPIQFFIRAGKVKRILLWEWL